MKKNNAIYTFLVLVIVIGAGACTKPASNLEIPPALVHFIGEKSQTYTVDPDPAPVYKVMVGATTVSDQDREVGFAITSITGATEGTHYNVVTANNTVTIPAGESIANIEIRGITSQYTSGRKDTLQIVLKEPSVSLAEFSDTVMLVLRGPCFDGAITDTELAAMLGTYNNSVDGGIFAWGPYTTTVVSVTGLTPTTARAVINNVWDYGFGNLNFILDWTDPNNTFIRLENSVITSGDAGVINAAYDGMNIVIRNHPTPGTVSNTFSVCTGRINLRYQFGVYDPSSGAVLGYFGTVNTTVMQR